MEHSSMNPRIQKLIKQCTVQEFSDCVGGYETFDQEKFAQLIVEECCNRLSEETIRHDGYGYNQHELYNRLRKHFGIES
jgi:hypothetical protein